MKKISILGSTGSIGRQTLDIVRKSNDLEIISLSAHSNIELLKEQIEEFKPKMVSVGNEELRNRLKEMVDGVEILSGIEGMKTIAKDDSEILFTSVVGMVGLIPTLEAIKSKKTIALANKETLVTAGEIVMEEAKRNGIKIIPVDSEHSAIYQCLNGERQNEIEKILLTASGGPFRGMKREDLEKVKLEDALKHPNWTMGKKITIDSASLMNKGLEFIEAKWLFDIDIDKIEVLVHPESIVHSMVEFVDGSIIAQLGAPDMRIPIQYAITEPNRRENDIEKIDLTKIGQLNFEKPDINTFKPLYLAIESAKLGGTMPAVLNAANEELVAQFLNEKIRFTDIFDRLEMVLEKHDNIKRPNLQEILAADEWARKEIIKKV
ncbi:MAG: 1-deoxy-D-xylulose-5-phosphate reductoisomerase [Andreesenia angusta]|nr:1-deoxy-D-xylulose-5-phosphate reductoisomerase [Andreesenia angusta]